MPKLTVSGANLLLGAERLSGEIGIAYYYGAQDALLGTNTDYLTDLPSIASYGIRVIRMPLAPFWPNDWSSVVGAVTPSNGTYLSRLDALYNTAAANGISIIGTLFWRFATVADWKGETIAAAFGSAASATRTYWRAFATEIVTRLKDHAACGGWEVTNEWEAYGEAGSFLPTNTGKGTPASYTAPTGTLTLSALQDTALEFRNLVRGIDNPRTLVLMGACAPQPFVTRSSYWRRRQFSDPSYSDHVDTHLYSYIDLSSRDVSQSGPFLARLKQMARKRPVILGEFGAGPTYDVDNATSNARIATLYTLIKRADVALAIEWGYSNTDPDFGVHPSNARGARLSYPGRTQKATGFISYRDPKNGPPYSVVMNAVGGATTGIDIPDAAILKPTVFTALFWARLRASTTATVRKPLMKGNGTTAGWRFALLPDANRNHGSVYGELKATDTTNYDSSTADSGPLFNTWAHHAMTFDGRYMLKWRDGLSIGNRLDLNGKTWTPSTSSLRIGSNAGSEPWDGNISDVRIYNRVLSADEINAVMGGAELRGGLVGWWKLNGDALDSSGNGNHGTPEASVAWQEWRPVRDRRAA